MPPAFNPPVGGVLATLDRDKDVQYDEHCSVVEGVVSPHGQGAWAGHGDDYDVHSFEFAGWRLLGMPLLSRELSLLRPVPPSREGQQREENIFDRFPAYSIQRFNVLLSKDQTRGVVAKVLTIDTPDQELLAFSERLREPVVILTEQFGELVLNPTIGWFEGKRLWNDSLIEICFEMGEDDGINDSMKTAETLWSDQVGWNRKVEDYAVQELLQLKNESWLEEDETELTPNDFKSRMTLDSITVAEDGRFEFWHDDGDMFWGHAILIRGTLEDGITDAGIEG